MDEVQVQFDLDGWSLLFVRLERVDGFGSDLAALRVSCAAGARERLSLASLATHPTVAALRKLFRQAGCDPTRYRPSSEALIRRILKGADLPAINSLVDLNNCLSLALAVPCCVMAAETLSPPYRLRAGTAGESYESLKGPFNLEGKPLLVDAEGPCDAPITGSRRVMIQEDTRQAVLVVYLPRGVVDPLEAERTLEGLVAAAPVVSVLGSGYSPTQPEQTQQREHG